MFSGKSRRFPWLHDGQRLRLEPVHLFREPAPHGGALHFCRPRSPAQAAPNRHPIARRLSDA